MYEKGADFDAFSTHHIQEIFLAEQYSASLSISQVDPIKVNSTRYLFTQGFLEKESCGSYGSR